MAEDESRNIEKPVLKGKDPTTGQFVKGNTYTPRHRKGRKTDNYELLRAIEAAYTPEQITELVREAVDMAREAGDWKGVYTVFSFIMAYTVGKPVQRTLTASMNADEIRAMFFADAFGGEDDGVRVVEVDGGGVREVFEGERGDGDPDGADEGDA